MPQWFELRVQLSVQMCFYLSFIAEKKWVKKTTGGRKIQIDEVKSFRVFDCRTLRVNFEILIVTKRNSKRHIRS